MAPSKRNLSKLSKLASAGSADEEVVAPEKRKNVGILAGQDNTLSRLATGKLRAVEQLEHPPAKVRIWSEHDRDYGALSTESCADLIDGFRRAGKQEFAAIVRKIPDDDGFDYELICGARRHWTATHLGWDLLVEVRDLNDRQAFVLLDLENRDREDVSDYERAQHYKRALPMFFENKRKDMAKELDIHPSLFGRILDLADLPAWLVKAYRDRRELKVHHGQAYKRLLTDASSKRRMREAVQSFAGAGHDGNSVFKLLKKAGAKEKPAPKRKTREAYGRIAVSEGARGEITLKLPAAKRLKEKEIEGLQRSFAAFMKDYSDGASDT